jgi:hypothetical protein
MSHFSWLTRTALAVVLLLAFTGVTLAADNGAPSTPTGVNVATSGVDGQRDRFGGVALVNQTTYVAGGQGYYTANDYSAIYVKTSTGGTFTPYAGGLSANGILMNDIVYSGSAYYVFGTSENTPGSVEYGRATGFNSAGTALWTVNDHGETDALTQFNAAILLSNGTNAGDFYVVGTTDGTATGTQDAYVEILQISDGALLNPADNTTTGATALQWGTASHTIVLYGVIERSDGSLIVVGSDDDGGGNDPYFRAINQDDGAAVTSFSAPTFTETGILYGIAAGPGANEYIVVGTTADSPAEGLIALITDNTDGTFTTQWEHTYAHGSDATALYDAAVSPVDSDILAVGNRGDLAYAIEIIDNGDNSATEDWDSTYDLVSGQAGERLYDMSVLTNGGFVAVGQVTDGSADTDGLLAQFGTPPVLPGVPTYVGPADAATGVDHTTVELSWSDNAGDDATANWDVYFSETQSEVTNMEVAALVADGQAVGTTTYDPTASTAFGTTYYWRVVAVDSDGDENAAAVRSFTTQGDGPEVPTTPSPADDATAQAVTVDLSWADGVGGTDTDNWDVFFGTDSAAVANKTATQVVTAQAVGTTTVLNAALNSGNPLATGTQYFWMVVANDAAAGTTNSPVWDFTTVVPAQPTIVAPANDATNIGINNAALDWAAGGGGSTIASWTVYFGTDSALVDDKDVSARILNAGAAATTIIPQADVETFLGGALTETTKYWWKVVASDGNATTDGTLWNFTTKTTVNPAVAVIGTPADAATGIAVTASVNWTDGVETDAVTGYDLYFSHEAGPVYSMLDIAKVIDDTDVLTYDPTGDMDAGVTYYWRLVARDGDNDTATGAVWSFTTASVTYPAAAHTPSPVNDATGVTVSDDPTWQNGDPTGFDNVATYDVYLSSTYADVAGKNVTARVVNDQAATDANANSVQTYVAGDFSAGTLYYWMVIATDGDGDETDGPIWAFTTAGNAPVPPETPAPSTGATGVAFDNDPFLDWADDQGTPGGTISAVTYWNIYLSTNQAEVTNKTGGQITTVGTAGDLAFGTTAITLAEAKTHLSVDPIPYGTTYYWRIVAFDTDDDGTDGPVWSFTTEVDPTQNIYVTYGAGVGSYADNNKKAGLQPSATDGYDSGIDIPIPPDPSSHLSTYFYRSDFTGFQQKLTEEWKDYDSYTLASGVAMYDFQVATDQTALTTLTFDATTGNTDSHPVILWSEDVNSGEYQNVLGSDADNTYTFTPDGTTTYNFTLLIGDGTGPVVTPVVPEPETGFAQGDTTTFPRSSPTTINVDFDDTCPVRQMTIEYSLSDNDSDPRNVRTNFVALAASPITYSSWDDPVADGGIYNANLTYDWTPVDEAGITSSTLEYDAQLRFVTTDWAGNSTTTIVDIIIGSDSFTYPVDDYNDAGGNGWGTGWHLISVPLEPDDALPADVFANITGNFSVFEWTEAAGMAAETDVAIAQGYWLSLDNAQATGLGDVTGTLAGPAENVDLTLAPSAVNLVGVSVRNADLSGNTVEADDWVFSDDDFTSTYTWTEATTTADKGGDSNIWISATSLRTFDNNADDYSANIAADAALTPGYGYTITAGTVTAGALKMRQVRDTIDNDSVPDDPDNGETGTGLDELDEVDGEFFVPIHISMADFYNDLSGFGTHPEATDGWDNAHDVNAPPLPPSGNYVRAIMDRQDWDAPFGRYFVRDVRALFDETTTEMTWNFIVYASQVGNVTMEFLANPEDYNLPEGFTARAIVNGETEFDLLESQEISFNYTGGQVPVQIVLQYFVSGIENELTGIPTEYGIHSVYPNPFNPSTMVRIALPEVSDLNVTVYNVLGKQVATLATGNFNAGYHSFVFDADAMASGVYFVRASVPGKLNQISKVVLVR